jgi:DNA invertase Pin-like site-specific DNA recombinase
MRHLCPSQAQPPPGFANNRQKDSRKDRRYQAAQTQESEVRRMTNQAVSYMRCSGASQIEGDTWDRQTASIDACCAALNLQPVHQYREEGVSGTHDENSRPAFQEMVADLLGNGCRTVVVESLDRLARDYAVQQRLAEYLASKDITLISANTGQDITAALMGDPMRRAMVQMQGVFAELERRMLVAKLKKARQRKKLRTGKGEGRDAFGAKPGEAAALEKMLAFSGQGLTSRQIAAQLDADGIPTRMGKPWTAGSVCKILRRQKAGNRD